METISDKVKIETTTENIKIQIYHCSKKLKKVQTAGLNSDGQLREVETIDIFLNECFYLSIVLIA